MSLFKSKDKRIEDTYLGILIPQMNDLVEAFQDEARKRWSTSLVLPEALLKWQARLHRQTHMKTSNSLDLARARLPVGYWFAFERKVIFEILFRYEDRTAWTTEPWQLDTTNAAGDGYMWTWDGQDLCQGASALFRPGALVDADVWLRMHGRVAGYSDVASSPSEGQGIESSETKVCPFCAEEIKFKAIKCKHCGSMLD